ncbi:uncharacterized protein KZ484_002511 isoform 2-T3 [Pholidichthys leucotaenia]
MEETRKSLGFLLAEITTITAQQKKIMDLVVEVQALRQMNMEKDKKISFLEERVDDLEQYSRGNDLIISGLRTRHQSYAGVVASAEENTNRRGTEETEAKRESLEQQAPPSRNCHSPAPSWKVNMDSFLSPISQLPNTNQPIPANCTATERMILEQLEELHFKMDHLMAILLNSGNRAHNEDTPNDTSIFSLPLSTVEELDTFDQRLQQDSSFKKCVIAKLSMSGGDSVKKTVWRVCGKVFSPDLATQLNWCGRGKKTGIKSRPIQEILISSILRHPALNHATEAEVESGIKNWLRLSQDRLGGRQRQRPQPQP